MKTHPIIPLETLPLENFPLTLPLETRPAKTLPLESLPLETLPLETLPMKTLPLESLPLETLPLKTLPLDSRPLDSLPLDSLPLDSLLIDSQLTKIRVLPHPTSPPRPKVIEILTTCPERQAELRGTKCKEGLTCSYGSQPCCGKTKPAREFFCIGGEMTESIICCLGCPGPQTTINPFLRTTDRELELKKNTESECNCPEDLDQAKFVCGSDGVTYTACWAKCIGVEIASAGYCG